MISIVVLLIALSGNVLGQNITEPPIYKIIGGGYVYQHLYPFMVSLQYYGSHNCGGSIISQNFVLTAAHCLTGITSNAMQYLKVVVGTNDLNSGNRKVYDAAETIYPANYNAEKLIFDVGLVRTLNSIIFNAAVQPIALDKNFININTPAVMIGWGRTSTNGQTSTILKSLNVNIQFTNCNFNNLEVNQQRQIGTFKQNGEGACFGDSGSPLIANGRQIGIFSFMSNPCATGYCDVFSRVSHLINWIYTYSQNTAILVS